MEEPASSCGSGSTDQSEPQPPCSTAAEAATFHESTPLAIGIFTTESTASSVSGAEQPPSAPSIDAVYAFACSTNSSSVGDSTAERAQ